MADRLHNMRTLEYTKPEKQRNKAAETLSVYCPYFYIQIIFGKCQNYF